MIKRRISNNYVYGEKELYYVSSIETKDYKAVFELVTRDDGYGVIDENGGFSSSSKSKMLKSITLYHKSDYDSNPSLATPIKKVNFEYDYSLCKGVGNNIAITNSSRTQDDNNFPNQGGKLTLIKIQIRRVSVLMNLLIQIPTTMVWKMQATIQVIV